MNGAPSSCGSGEAWRVRAGHRDGLGKQPEANVLGTARVPGTGKRGVTCFLSFHIILTRSLQWNLSCPLLYAKKQRLLAIEICSPRPCLAEAGSNPSTLKQCSSFHPTTCSVIHPKLGVSCISDT